MPSNMLITGHQFRLEGTEAFRDEQVKGVARFVEDTGTLYVGQNGDRPTSIVSDRKCIKSVVLEGKCVHVDTCGENAGTHRFVCANARDARSFYNGAIAGPSRMGALKTKELDVHNQLAVQTVVGGGNVVFVSPMGVAPVDVRLSGQEGHDVVHSLRAVGTDDTWAISDNTITRNVFASDKLGGVVATYDKHAAANATVVGTHKDLLLVWTPDDKLVLFDSRTARCAVIARDIRMKPTANTVMCSDEDGRVFLLRSYGVIVIEDLKYTPEMARLAYQAPCRKLNRDTKWYDGVEKIDVHDGRMLFVANPPAWVRVDVPPLPWVADGHPGEGAVLPVPPDFGPVVDGKLVEDEDDPDNLLAVLVDAAGRIAMYDLSVPGALPVVSADQRITAIAADTADRTVAVGAVNARGLCELKLATLSMSDDDGDSDSYISGDEE